MARKSQAVGHRRVAVSFCILAAVLMGCSIERVDKSGSSNTTGGAQTDGSGAAGTGAASRSNDEEKPVVAFVTNGIASFWTVAEAGCRAAERDFNCEVLVRMPDGAADQKRMLEELISLQIDGAAVSPIDPENQADILNAVGQATNFVTQDSDAPNTQRLAYIGMDNYRAGRTCGKLVKEAIPDGGEVMIFVGRLGQLNADLRRQGVIDELLDRDDDSSRRDPPSAKLTNGKYTILDTRTDNFNFGDAKAQVEDTIVKYPNVGCMVGLFAYNPPAILEAVQGADKLGQIKIVAFDEDDGTLQGIADGHCFGTVVQDPYQYGYESVRILAQLARGDRSVLPENKFKEFPERVIRQDNVAEFWEDLKQKMELGRSKADSPQTPTRVRLAFVTNNASDFWKIAEAGVRKAEQEFDVECEIQFPPNGTADDQQRIVEALIAKGITGMAISPNDAQNQIGLIDQAAEVMDVLCHDSDAPDSKRLAYVGTRNYKAGREAGKQIKQILPDGGTIAMFVGRLDAQNALEREQGVRDELEGTKIRILDTLTDLTDRARAKQNVEDTLAKHPDIGCLVGLWSYNGPAILEAVTDAGLAGKKSIVCFDEESRTLRGIEDGHIVATVVQQPFEFGYQSVRILAALARGQDAGIPEDKIVEVPVRVVNRENVDSFWSELRKLTGSD